MKNIDKLFLKIVNTIAVINCLNSGQSIKDVAVSAKVTPKTIKKWIKEGGFIFCDDGLYRKT